MSIISKTAKYYENVLLLGYNWLGMSTLHLKNFLMSIYTFHHLSRMAQAAERKLCNSMGYAVYQNEKSI